LGIVVGLHPFGGAIARRRVGRMATSISRPRGRPAAGEPSGIGLGISRENSFTRMEPPRPAEVSSDWGEIVRRFERQRRAGASVVHNRKILMAVILIVEDDMLIRDVTNGVVEDLGHDTLLASDVAEALQHLRSPRRIDALIADIRLKTVVLGGFEVARQAIALRPDLSVLYTTGNSLSEELSALFVRGAQFLQKPYTQDQLENSVEKLLAA
jgi:CheY-like chemotaxis protein